MGLPSYPKILPLGHFIINKIYDGEVELTEKVDGSQYKFGNVLVPTDLRVPPTYELKCGTKKSTLDLDTKDKLFKPAVDHCKKIAHLLPVDRFFFAETLCKPKHNVLAYDSTPKNNIALFAGLKPDATFIEYEELEHWANILDVGIVPILYQGICAGPDFVIKLLQRQSYLGGPNIEGVVAKNYNHSAMIDSNRIYPYLVGKYVSEDFKEKHQKDFKKGQRKETLIEFFQSYNTEARRRKAVQHLRDEGMLTGEPKDIGPLMKELQTDFLDEHIDEVKERLWQEYRKQVLHHIMIGFPEWYKEQIMKGEIDVE